MNKKIRKIGAKIYIFCNGEKAEPLYFQDFKDFLKTHRIIVSYKNFSGKAPWDFIYNVINSKEKLIKNDKFSSEDRDQIWCIFDVDDYWKQNEKEFRAALKLAEEKNIYLAWSNQCFELWFLCHFESSILAMPRTDYHEKLAKHFKDKKLGKYTKNMERIFKPLSSFQQNGIKNARKLHVENKMEKDPSTAVFLLVETLLNL